MRPLEIEVRSDDVAIMEEFFLRYSGEAGAMFDIDFWGPFMHRFAALGGRINVRNAEGRSALHLVVDAHVRHPLLQKALVQLFVRKGAMIDYQWPRNGCSPLHVAAWYGSVEVIRALLYLGANKALQNTRGQTAAEVALEQGDLDAARVIDDYPVDLAARRREDLEMNAARMVQAGAQLNGFMTRPIRYLGGIFEIVPKSAGFVSSAVLVTLVFMTGVFLMRNNEEIHVDRKKMTGEFCIAVSLIGLIIWLSHELYYVKRTGSEMVENARRRMGLLSDALTETIISGRLALAALKDSTNTVDDVLRDFRVTARRAGAAVERVGAAAEGMLGHFGGSALSVARSVDMVAVEVGGAVGGVGRATRQAVVQLKDEFNNSLVQLRGEIGSVCGAIRRGVEEGRFKPEANVNVAVDVEADIDVDARSLQLKGFSIF